MFAISIVYESHQKIEQLFEQLRSIANKKGNGKMPVREKPPGPAMIGGMMQPPGEDAPGRANDE